MDYPTRVRIYEVGPRDGLQNEATPISTEAKLRYIELLRDAGLREIEATSFVSPSAIPQLADADDLMAALRDQPRDGVRYPVLVPNMRGMERAEAAGADALAVFTAASDEFTRRNIGMTIDESIEAFRAGPDARHRAWLVEARVRFHGVRLPLHRRGCDRQGGRGQPAAGRPRCRRDLPRRHDRRRRAQPGP